MADILRFLLVPDRSSARFVRRALATDGARWGTVVGTWSELADQARRAYLLPPHETDWKERLGEAARKLTDGFWSESLKADPEGTLATVDRELRRLLAALGPGKELQPAGKSALSERGKRHLADLARLHEAMGKGLPENLAVIQALLSAAKADAVRVVAVHRKEKFPSLSPWQEALLAKLASDCDSTGDPVLAHILARTLEPVSAGKAKSALHHLQESLFLPEASQGKLDDSIEILAVRDDLESAEVAAGMAQRALATVPGLKTSDIGLLLPSDGSCDQAVREVFSRAGLPLSGLPDSSRLRNLGGEAVFHFLATRRRPAPAMALAALYASPLMPWDETTGNRLAMEVMEGTYYPEAPDDLGIDGRRMMELLREKHETPKAFSGAMKIFSSSLTSSESMKKHVGVAQDAVGTLTEVLKNTKGKDVPWEELAALVPQAPVPPDTPTELTREGVAVLREDEEPWRPLRLLYVLGFSDGRYPGGPGRSPILDAADAAVLKNELGFGLETAEETMDRRRGLFLRQLRGTRDRVVFFSPAQNGAGEPVALCGTTAFMARLFKGIKEPEDLVLTLEREAHREKVDGLAIAPPASPVLPRVIEVRDPKLPADLLTDRRGKLRHVTPSGLDTLMVSPLAWFLNRLGVGPLSWAPETLDPAKKGTLAHEVFEKLFAADAPLPTDAKIKSSVDRMLNEAVLQRVPFLLGTQWYVERSNLLRDIETAALRWRQLLDRSGAKILAVETNLDGVFEGVPIRGRTDLLFSIPSGKIFVVDYKKSSSSSRRKCMEEGYDLQTSLYRQMLRSGGAAGETGKALTKTLKDGADIGVLYYMMDDQKALTDTSAWLPRTVPGVQELGGEISVHAEALVKERIRELRAGIIRLNRETDEKDFEKLGVKTYALEDSPLISKFFLPAGEAEEAE